MKVDRNKLTSGRQKAAYRVGVYGVAAVGKTTFAAGAPHPLFLDLERGSSRLNVPSRVVPETWEETIGWVEEFEQDAKLGQTIVIDSVTKLEGLLHKHLCGANPGDTIENFGGGYGRGDSAAVQTFRELLSRLDRIVAQGRHVVLVAHAIVKKFEDPSSTGWERYELGLRPKLAGATQQWLDFLLFAKPRTVVIDPKASKKRAADTGERIAHTAWSAAYEAKARGELTLPDPIPLAWSEFEAAVEAEEARAAHLRTEITRMVAEIGSEEYAGIVKQFLGSNPKGLIEAHEKVSKRLVEKKEKAA